MSDWVAWLAAFMIVLAILAIGVAVQEWWEWEGSRGMTAEDRMKSALKVCAIAAVIIAAIVLIPIIRGVVWWVW